MKVTAKLSNRLLAGLIAATLTLLSMISARAQDVWTNSSGDYDWEDPSNWTNGVPADGANVVFNSTLYSNSLSNETISASLNSITFNAPFVLGMYQPGTYSLQPDPITLSLTGSGIIPSSDVGNIIVFGNSYALYSYYLGDNSGGDSLIFYGSASSGNSNIENTSGDAFNFAEFSSPLGGTTTFTDSSNAGTSSIENDGTEGPFQDSGGDQVVTGSGTTLFNGASSANRATISNDAGSGTGAPGQTLFSGYATAGHATISNYGASASLSGTHDLYGGATTFQGSSSAGFSTIYNGGGQGYVYGPEGGGTTVFQDSSSAGSARLVAEGGNYGNAGAFYFIGNATGGSAVLDGQGGLFDISGDAYAVSVGAIEGTGNINLGGQNLTVGNLNSNTTYSGLIADGGLYGGTGGSLSKIGTGTLTLTGANTYSGNTTINFGTLAVSGAGASINSPTIGYVFAGLNRGDNGTLLVSSGGQVNVSDGYVGFYANSTGTVNVTGGSGGTASTLSVNGGGGLFVGCNGQGTLNIQNGGQVSDGPGVLGADSGGTGTATVAGVNGNTPSTWSNSSGLYVGQSGTGTLNLDKGGVVTVGAGTGTVTLAQNTGSTGTLNIGNGGTAGTLQAAEVTGGSGTAKVNFGETDSSYTFAPKLTGNLSVTQSGSGTTILTGANTYSGGTTIVGGTLDLKGGTGSLASGSNLAFTGTGAFDYDNSSSSATANNQALGVLAFSAGDGTVESTLGSARSAVLSFTSMTHALGATGDFFVNGSAGGANKIEIAGQSTGFLSPGLFFDGSNYATYDSGGFVRGINYGVDAGSIVDRGGSTISGGTLNSTTNVELTGNITDQQSATINTLNMGDNNLTLGADELTLNGILESGGAATISGASGSDISSFGHANLVIRTNLASDSLTIDTFVVAQELTKSGAGTLTLNGSFTGNVYLDGGTLGVGNGVTITGPMVVTNGSTQINGTVAGTVTVGTGGTVGGSGKVNGKVIVASGGSTYPGDPQILSMNNVEYQDGSTAQFAVDTTSGSSHPPTPGVDYDQIQLTGGPAQVLQIDPGTTTLQLNLSASTLAYLQSSADPNDLYFVFSLGSGTSTGQFSDLTLTEGANSYTDAITNGTATFAQLGLQFNLSYTASELNNSLAGGNDVAFDVQQVPEPSTWATMLGGLGLLAFWRGRARRVSP